MLPWVFLLACVFRFALPGSSGARADHILGRLLQVLDVILGRYSWLLLDVNVGNGERSFEVREFMVLSLPLVTFLARRCVGFALAAFQVGVAVLEASVAAAVLGSAAPG